MLIMLFTASHIAFAQSNLDPRLTAMVERLTKFGQNIPQEKVYVHMDNTCYFVGDTIWYAAYTRSTHNDQPSKLSGTLYVELYNQDGYLVERQLVEMLNGRGHGNFVLEKDCYGGFYELRAYTRWQLNWGQFEHKNASVSKQWFLNDDLHHNYFRDYEKLYSRVFPVYDAPKNGEYIEEMTLRPMRRYFKKEPGNRDINLTLYPEGGNVVAGLPCRVAYEATWDDGEMAELEGHPSRGIIEVTPEPGKKHNVTFTTKEGRKLSASLPTPEKEGVALRMAQSDEAWTITLTLSQGLNPKDIGMTVMHQGVVEKVSGIDAQNTGGGNALQAVFDIDKSELKEGVNQITVFDVEGRILADRLFFNTHPTSPIFKYGNKTAQDEVGGTFGRVGISLGGDKRDTPLNEATFAPYSPIQLQVQSEPGALLSMSVRDVAHSDELNDNADMRVEMLLSSEIKGFVANPQYYFERDDEKHRDDLDLLMMIQGWRRFNWRDMAVAGNFELTQPLERAPIIKGRVYENPEMADVQLTDEEFIRIASTAGMYFANPEEGAKMLLEAERAAKGDWNINSSGTGATAMEKLSGNAGDSESESSSSSSSEGRLLRITEEMNENGVSLTRDEERERYGKKAKKGKEKLVHLELVSIDGKDVRVQETMTKNGEFAFQLPGFYGAAILFLTAEDSTKWDKKDKANPAKHTWIQMQQLEEELPEGHRGRFRVWPSDWTVRQFTPYPRFVKPYNYYQEQQITLGDSILQAIRLQDGTTQMKEVRIGAKRSGMKRFSDSIPAFMVDAYDAYNYALDAGMFNTFPEDIVRAYVGDYGREFPYVEVPIPGGASITHSNIFTRFGYDQSRRATNNVTTNADSAFIRSNLISFQPYDKTGTVNSFLSYAVLREYYQMQRLDKYVIYTDYQPRLAGDARYDGSLLPETNVAVYPFADDSRRVYYRDRRYVQYGYNYADDFYHPNYQNRKLDDKPKDYRRTLYWNPELQLDKDGKATVNLYNNGKSGMIKVSAEGMTAKGTILGN